MLDHNFCFFYKNNKSHFAWIKDFRKNKRVVISDTGTETILSNNQITYSWKGKSFSNDKEALDYLKKKSIRVEEKSQAIDIEVIYELCEPGQNYTLDKLSEDFLDNPDDGWENVSFLIALKNYSRLFKSKKNNYSPRTNEEIEKFDREIEKASIKQEKEEREKKWSELLLSNRLPEIDKKDEKAWHDFIHRFKKSLIFMDRSSEKRYFSSLFNHSFVDPTKLEQKCMEILKLCGHPLSWGKLQLERMSVKTEFNENSLEESEKITKKDIWKTGLDIDTRDHRKLECYTVDNEYTKDFDDAINLEKTGEAIHVRVYISDVASFLPLDNPLFDEVRKRVSSLYTPKEIIPMFPKELSEDFFSLLENHDRSVMTFDFEFGSEGNILNFEIYRAIIRVKENLSYEIVDSKIEENDLIWVTLWELCKTQKRIRMDKGALDLDRIEVKMDISDPDNIKIHSIRENTPATLLVQELAILANGYAAQYCKKHRIPGPFRSQPPYIVSKNLSNGEKPTLFDLQIKPAKVCLDPEFHAGLGLDCYVQVTSPIRRFLDLVTQKMIFASLSGIKDYFSEETLLPWAKNCEQGQKEYNQLEKTLTNHWKIKYLHQHKGEIVEVKSIHYLRNGKVLVQLPEIDLIADITMEGLEEGENFEGKIINVDVPYHRFSLSKI